MTRATRRWSVTEIEAHAHQVRVAAGDTRLPVPLPRIAKSLGVRVEGAHLGDTVTAVLVVGDRLSTIGYPWYQPSPRQRFGIAHALGHDAAISALARTFDVSPLLLTLRFMMLGAVGGLAPGEPSGVAGTT